MRTSTDKTADGGEDLLDSPADDSSQSSPRLSSPAPMHMYPFAPGLASRSVRSKRRQVKNACTNCQKACKKCDEARPCLRCVKYGVSEECVDSQRKERKKGAKRGPYRKRDGKGDNIVHSDDPSQDGEPDASPHAGGSSPPAPFVGSVPVGYTPGFYAQFPPPPGHKPGEPAYYPQFYLAPVPAPPNAGQEGESSVYPPPQFFPPTFMAPYGQPYPPYMQAHPDGQMVPHYPGAGSPVYVKPPVSDETVSDETQSAALKK
ncbi:hypothetical protein C8R44DRAFT_397480 [Mycena epipterygia]|nr:hypothetical protein C8R44DRAFT_397480 [Mycena epipterygia]